MRHIYCIAEIGVNHNGSLTICKNLIDAAKDAGCDAVKFQKRTVDIVYTAEELAKARESPWGSTNGDLKYHLEFGYNEYAFIDSYCRKIGIDWFASPWDVDSVYFLEQFDMRQYKVASACITDLQLLGAIGATKKPVIISTGMSNLDEIRAGLNWFSSATPVTLMACVSTYPTVVKDLNLLKIQRLKEIFPHYRVGYSGHEVGLWTTLCAVALGAEVIERHITLDRAMWGSDHAASLEPQGFKKLIEEIRTFELALGDGTIKMTEAEKPVREKLRRIK